MLKRMIVGGGIAAGSWYAFNRAMRWRATWGVTPEEAVLPLAGDDLVPAAGAVDTRGITIDAPPEAVWPWLVQMGYGRAGWYSYDRLDMDGRSADNVVPGLQSLAVGDTVPTDPGGGFVVRALDPGRALVLGIDEEILARRQPGPTSSAVGSPGLAASGRFLEAAVPPRFRASWAFVLDPLPDGRTRLVERFRAWFGEDRAMSRLLGPLLGFGVFVMMRRQMLGIRERAERMAGVAAATTGAATTGATTPAPGA